MTNQQFSDGDRVTDNGEDIGVVVAGEPDFDGRVVVRFELDPEDGVFLYSAVPQAVLDAAP